MAETLGGKRYPASGSKAWDRDDKTTARGDVKTKHLHLDHKYTDHESYRLTVGLLKEVSAGARRQARDPAVVVTFDQSDLHEKDWIVLPLSVYKRLLGE